MTTATTTNNILWANAGDKVQLTNGDVFEFVRLKRTKFIGKKDGQSYDIPVQMFVKIVENAEPKKLNDSYKSLNSGELFYIIGKNDDALIFKFKEMKDGRIIGTNVIHGGRTRIDCGLYGGKVSEL